VVVVFLRGGADGLSLVVPTGDEAYYRLRPNLAVSRKSAVPLTDFFGLHPSLATLMPEYEAGRLAALQAVGSQDQTRSHFEAMDTMERGVADREGPSTGWVARYLAATQPVDPSPVRALALGSTTPTALVGAQQALTLGSLDEFRLQAPSSARTVLADLYGRGTDQAAVAGRATLEVLDAVERVDVRAYRAQNGAAYPDSELGAGLRQVACLVRADVGLEVACLDKGGWDTHFAQGTATVGLLPSLLSDLGASLAAFARDLGPEMGRVTVVVMSEFGRRLAENASLGTDHGHGGAMFLLGGGVRGGTVHARWPGLDHPIGPGDLDVTTDYRDVLAEILSMRMGLARAGAIFPNHTPVSVGLVA